MGPVTGRGAGFCTGYAVPGYLNPLPRCGMGGRFGGRGWRNWYHATGLTGWQRAAAVLPAWGGIPVGASEVPRREDQIAALKAQAEQFEKALQTIRKRLEDLESPSEKDS